MELPNNTLVRVIVLAGLSASLGACSMFGGGKSELARADAALLELPANGPQADYPQVLGAAFTVEGQEYVPVDTASYDAVGYAALEGAGGQGITLAHKTLPLPSYVEVTELDSGRTILARVERRGPMSNDRLVALSPGAQALLGARDGAPVRVRRINPPETDRAELRSGRRAAERMDTPKSLLTVLQRKLPTAPGVVAVPLRAAQTMPAAAPTAAPVVAARTPTRELPATVPAPVPAATSTAGERTANTAYPLGGAKAAAARAPLPQVVRNRPVAQQAPAPVAAAQADPVKGDFVIQAAAFSSKSNADRAAGKLGGFVTKTGSLYRVRTGPYASRGQAEAALAKVREAGYSDARVFTAG